MHMPTTLAESRSVTLETEAELYAAHRSFTYAGKAIRAGRCVLEGNWRNRMETKFRLGHLTQESATALITVRTTPVEFKNDFLNRRLKLNNEKDIALLGLSARLLLQREQLVEESNKSEPTNACILEFINCGPDYLPCLVELAQLPERAIMPYSDARVGNSGSGRS